MGTHEFGDYLRSKREALGLSAADISDRTRIHLRHIRALEEGRTEFLPGAVYARAFVRHYARAIGEDPDRVAAEFDQAVQLEKEAVTYTRSKKRSRRRARRTYRIAWPWVAVVVFLALLGVVVSQIVDFSPVDPNVDWAFGEDTVGYETPDAELELDESLGSSGPEVLEPPADVEPVVDVEPAVDVELVVDVEGDAVETDAVVSALAPMGGVVASDAPSGGSVSGESVSVESSDVDSAPDESAAGTGVVLEVAVEQACWFSVEADGAVIFVGILEGGERATWTADNALRVRYGRPEGVYITLNGEYLGVAGSGVITRVYTRDGTAGADI